VLLERQEIRALVLNYTELSSFEPRHHRLAFTVSYQPLRGKRRSQTYEYDLDTFLGLVEIGRKSINDIDKRLDTIGKELHKSAQQLERLNARVEWGLLTPPKTESAGDKLHALLAYLQAWWLDYRSLGDSAYSGYDLHQMRVVCERAHDALCAYNCTGADHTRLRQDLLKLARITMWGPQSVGEINTLGEEVVAIAARLQQEDGLPPVDTANGGGPVRLLHAVMRRVTGAWATEEWRGSDGLSGNRLSGTHRLAWRCRAGAAGAAASRVRLE
jgi:hypothetical protein